MSTVQVNHGVHVTGQILYVSKFSGTSQLLQKGPSLGHHQNLNYVIDGNAHDLEEDIHPATHSPKGEGRHIWQETDTLSKILGSVSQVEENCNTVVN